MIKDIVGYEGLYQVTDSGDVISCERIVHVGEHYIPFKLERRVMSPFTCNGYLAVFLKRKGKRVKRFVHRLVAEAFIPNIHNSPIVNHRHGDKRDNRASELEWATASQNTNHYYKGRAMAEAHNDSF